MFVFKGRVKKTANFKNSKLFFKWVIVLGEGQPPRTNHSHKK